MRSSSQVTLVSRSTMNMNARWGLAISRTLPLADFDVRTMQRDTRSIWSVLITKEQVEKSNE